ncbi:Hypothetical protein FKW44_022941 [Caligus rogercresseyi]|uniref:Uncharacterized protein n=1 Tax=Caligus rogercresseyi TaxID=217165 RepID=A0A7T8GP34_CALRO|nr:Hypothetical protein FKW44_022941 [Caligus rogercresseyi]
MEKLRLLSYFLIRIKLAKTVNEIHESWKAELITSAFHDYYSAFLTSREEERT